MSRLAKEFGKDSRGKISLLSKFWKYCHGKGLCVGTNPFEVHLDTLSKSKKTPSQMQKRSLLYTALPETIARELDEVISKKVKDGRYAGFALVKEAGFPSSEACRLAWRDVEFMPEAEDFVCVRIRRDEISGATHDFTRPVMPFGGLILLRRYKHLLETYSEDTLQDMPIVSTAKNPQRAMKAKDLTAHCKIALLDAGLKHIDMVPDKNAEHGA